MSTLKLALARHTFSPDWTLGTLYAVGLGVQCFTLEDCDRLGMGSEKVPGLTAIPAGIYEIILANSPKFGKILPRVLDVPLFTGVLIHPGNWPRDTEGCILTGSAISFGKAERSQVAFQDLLRLMRPATKIELSIYRCEPSDPMEETSFPLADSHKAGWLWPNDWLDEGVVI